MLVSTDKIEEIAGKIAEVHIEYFALNESFLDFAARFASSTGTVILMSGGELDSARYHIVAAQPWLTFYGRRHSMTISAGDQTINFEADPFDTLRMLLNSFRLNHPDYPVPIAAGLFGYLSYDLKDNLERLPRTSIDDLCLPDLFFVAPSITVVHDKKNDKTCLCIPKRIYPGGSDVHDNLAAFEKIFAGTPPAKGSFSGDSGGFKSNFTKANYIDSIKKIREYIISGHVYQVNMSQRFEMDFNGDVFGLFRTLYDNNPAPFFAYINAGNHQIVSTSPERFLRRTGNHVETRPIKGTRPRGNTPAEDKKLSLELEKSKKDAAEISMIVDLLRNDLGKVCMAGSVRVAEHKRLEAYQNVYHLVSIVEGTLGGERDSVDLLTATFPGGSITGCPKIRSMEIIDELEPNRRHVYTGSIGYISFHDSMDLSIAIRTATIYNNKIIFSVGGGIVFDSNPRDEFDETMHKGRTLMEVFKGKEKSGDKKGYVWLNGIITPVAEACISVIDQGLQYGYGFFETIRVDQGNPKYLKEHLDRFYQTWKVLFSGETPDLTWPDIIRQVIEQNGLLKETAALKIIATRGDRETPPFNHTLLVTVRPYTHRLAGKEEPGLNLATYPKPRQTPLADHKTLNYLYYLLAGKWAASRRADEALIMNPDGTISETNTANLLLVNGKTIIRPISPHVLPGIMEKVVCNFLLKLGYRIEDKEIRPDYLFSVDEVLITNSLFGAAPVLTVDTTRTGKPSDLWQMINKAVL